VTRRGGWSVSGVVTEGSRSRAASVKEGGHAQTAAPRRSLGREGQFTSTPPPPNEAWRDESCRGVAGRGEAFFRLPIGSLARRLARRVSHSSGGVSESLRRRRKSGPRPRLGQPLSPASLAPRAGARPGAPDRGRPPGPTPRARQARISCRRHGSAQLRPRHWQRTARQHGRLLSQEELSHGIAASTARHG
jgi:hypothetical protein